MPNENGHEFPEIQAERVECKFCGVDITTPKAKRYCMGGTEKEVGFARQLVCAYFVGYKAATIAVKVPQTADELNSHGHDGLNWQAFLPLAKDILKRQDEDNES